MCVYRERKNTHTYIYIVFYYKNVYKSILKNSIQNSKMGGSFKKLGLTYAHCTYWKWTSLIRVRLFATPQTIQSMEFSRPEYWSGYPFPSPGYLPNPGIEPRPPTLQMDSLPSEPPGKSKNTGVGSLSLLQRNFPTQESNWSLLHHRQILYHLSNREATLHTLLYIK